MTAEEAMKMVRYAWPKLGIEYCGLAVCIFPWVDRVAPPQVVHVVQSHDDGKQLIVGVVTPRGGYWFHPEGFEKHFQMLEPDNA